MPLFLIQDSDRPLYVFASSWSVAIEKWKAVIAKENEIPLSDVDDHQGINKIADNDELVIVDDIVENSLTILN